MTCPFSLDDGAYVLGALAPGERAVFERHLSSCKQCRAAVAALAVLPGLLGRLDTSTAAAQVAAPPTLLPRVLATAASRRRADRRLRRWSAIAFAFLAVVVAAMVGLGVHGYDARTIAPQAARSPMRPVSDNLPASAEMGLVEVRGGTRVDMVCRYAAWPKGTWTLRLVVYPREGDGEQLGSWTAASGEEIALTALTHLSADQIARVEVQSETGRMLLLWNPA